MKYDRWHLDISSWRGISWGATHYYGVLQAPDGDHVRLTRQLLPSEVAELNRKDRFESYRIGDSTERFDSEEAVIAAGREEFHKRTRGRGAVLIKGSCVYADPMEPLAGPVRVVRALKAIWARAERIGGWKNEKEMTRLTRQWGQWWSGQGSEAVQDPAGGEEPASENPVLRPGRSHGLCDPL